MTREGALEDLDKALGVTQHLADTVCSRVAALQEKLDAAVAAAGGNEQDVSAADLAAIKLAAMAELEEGSWSYADILKELLATLKFLASIASGYFDEALAQQLWDMLMVNARCGEDQYSATQVSRQHVGSRGALTYRPSCGRVRRYSTKQWHRTRQSCILRRAFARTPGQVIIL